MSFVFFDLNYLGCLRRKLSLLSLTHRKGLSKGNYDETCPFTGQYLLLMIQVARRTFLAGGGCLRWYGVCLNGPNPNWMVSTFYLARRPVGYYLGATKCSLMVKATFTKNIQAVLFGGRDVAYCVTV